MTTTQPEGRSGVAWDELVGAALVGTERRTPPGVPPGQDPAAALLDAAAADTVRRRAGLRAAAPRPRPVPAPEDRRPPLPEAARRRLALLLADRVGSGVAGARRGATPDLTELLPQWLAAGNRAGPTVANTSDDTDADAEGVTEAEAPDDTDADIPGDTDADASGDTDADVPGDAGAGSPVDASGAATAASGPDGSGSRPGGTGADAVRKLWEEGLFAERVALLESVRRRDPSAAVALLGSTWPTERAEDRLMFLDSLRTGLSGADEPFLEQALSDRSRNVRATAAELLSALPGSALAGRMAARAASYVALDPTAAVPQITVEAPHECDAAMQRDGVVPKPPTGRGERAWWLAQLVEATPLGLWPERFGGRSPAGIVALPVTDDWRGELHAAWCRAAVRQRNPEWSRALLGSPAAAGAAAPGTASLGERAKLLLTLPAAERAGWVAEFIAVHGLSEAFQILGVCSVPWDGPLGRAVVDALDIARDAGSYPWSFSGVMGLAERCLDPAEADRLELLTATPDEPEGASPGAGSYWSEAFQRLVRTLRLRATMHAELSPDGSP
ncbi:DUF5691 domain-containing protein [Streptomyces sp. Ru87]|nr:DUF5691 domain-containing protein [Streptomyces sp. Ru87]PGH48619.1 hypothetical protein CRI70_22130 [Streptomyces sp. Ru87]